MIFERSVPLFELDFLGRRTGLGGDKTFEVADSIGGKALDSHYPHISITVPQIAKEETYLYVLNGRSQ